MLGAMKCVAYQPKCRRRSVRGGWQSFPRHWTRHIRFSPTLICPSIVERKQSNFLQESGQRGLRLSPYV